MGDRLLLNIISQEPNIKLMTNREIVLWCIGGSQGDSFKATSKALKFGVSQKFLDDNFDLLVSELCALIELVKEPTTYA